MLTRLELPSEIVIWLKINLIRIIEQIYFEVGFLFLFSISQDLCFTKQTKQPNEL